ncbi:hypothetical protein QOT17_025562, partial [Balamuthia mandrillaris]
WVNYLRGGTFTEGVGLLALWGGTFTRFAGFSSVPDGVFRSTFNVPASEIQQELSTSAALGTWYLFEGFTTEATASGTFTTGAAVTALTPSITDGPSQLVPGENFHWRFRLSNGGPSDARNAGCRVTVLVGVEHGVDGWIVAPSSCSLEKDQSWSCEFASE